MSADDDTTRNPASSDPASRRNRTPATHQDRVAASMRDNLLKRRALSRARAAQAPAGTPATGRPDPAKD